MSDNRIEELVSAMVAALRGVLKEKDVSFDEYRAGFQYMVKTADQGGLVTVLRRSLISLCHLGFECERADATQI